MDKQEIMDKQEVVLALKKMFEDKTDTESAYTVESRQIDKHSYLALVAKDRDEYVVTSPDYDAFINLLKYQNSRVCNVVADKLYSNRRQIFVDFDDTAKTKFLNDVRDLHSRLLGANAMNKALVEDMILDWVNDLFQ